jgi:hypothetical protein
MTKAADCAVASVILPFNTGWRAKSVFTKVGAHVQTNLVVAHLVISDIATGFSHFNAPCIAQVLSHSSDAL